MDRHLRTNKLLIFEPHKGLPYVSNTSWLKDPLYVLRTRKGRNSLTTYILVIGPLILVYLETICVCFIHFSR